MKVLVTGATGFVGQHLVRSLVESGHQVVAVARDMSKASAFDWYERVTSQAVDIHDCDVAKLVSGIDALAHLAWPGLPNYTGLFHFERNLPDDYAFLKAAVESGTKHLLVTGTCLEYGSKRAGCLTEDMVSDPEVPYAIAKDALRKFLECLQAEHSFGLQWVRLFYMHGQGQNPKSLLSQLDTALQAGQASFEMSPGEQLRDYLPVAEVGAILATLLQHSETQGVLNCCSGTPISVRRLVEEHLRARNARIELRLGVHSYPKYEALAFWGASEKVSAIRRKLAAHD
jgi:dTDP-6-deoxy-L-talose 4-dehydrogenase (NAD+)